jgi:hypothetical protein
MAQLAERDKTIAELQARIAAAPADTTTAVVDTAPQSEKQDDTDNYAAVVKGAHEMFNAIP